MSTMTAEQKAKKLAEKQQKRLALLRKVMRKDVARMKKVTRVRAEAQVKARSK